MDNTKLLAGSVVGAGAIALAVYLKTLHRAQTQLEVIPSAFIYKLNADALIIGVKAKIKNPTGASFKIKQPFIELLYKDTMIGSSQVKNEDIKIPAYGEVPVKDMLVEVPVLNFSVILKVARDLMNHVPIVFTIKVITTIDLGWSQMPFEHKQDLTVKK